MTTTPSLRLLDTTPHHDDINDTTTSITPTGTITVSETVKDEVVDVGVRHVQVRTVCISGNFRPSHIHT
jgi:hypothetical protein